MCLKNRSRTHAWYARALTIRTALIGTIIVACQSAQAQQPHEQTDSGAALDSLIAHAVAVSPAIRAAQARVDAARAKISPAGALPDPTLMAGIVNLPVARPSFTSDGMTMKMVGVGQTIPFPGKLAARRRPVELEANTAAVALDTVRLAVARSVKSAYYELAYLDHAITIVKQNEQVLGEVGATVQSHYSVGTGGQPDILKTRIAAAQLGETANALIEQRQATLAALNAALDQPSDTPIENPDFPTWLTRYAVSENTLGAPAADSPLPSLAQLQATAAVHNPGLRVHEAMIASQAARVKLAQTEYKPDLDVSVQYGQRAGLPDMVTALVSIPLRLHKGAVQDQQVGDARAELAALRAEHESQLNEVHATVARLYSEIEHNRTQLALYVRSILPQGEAAVASTTASYQVGKVDLLTLLDSQTTLFSYQTAYYRALADFGTAVAQLEQAVGQEVLK